MNQETGVSRQESRWVSINAWLLSWFWIVLVLMAIKYPGTSFLGLELGKQVGQWYLFHTLWIFVIVGIGAMMHWYVRPRRDPGMWNVLVKSLIVLHIIFALATRPVAG